VIGGEKPYGGPIPPAGWRARMITNQAGIVANTDLLLMAGMGPIAEWQLWRRLGQEAAVRLI